MVNAVTAIYEDGVFRPKEPVQLPEKSEVELQYYVRNSERGETDGSSMSIEDKIAEIAARVPAEEWAKLPADLSSQIDHYVYGIPKE